VVRASVELASEFFPKNTVVFSTRGRKKEVDTTYVTKRDGEFTGAPLIVLVDGGSASAAEALAASLQDHDRALLLGRRPSGRLSCRRSSSLRRATSCGLTIGRVITPSGRFIQRRYRGMRSEEYKASAASPAPARIRSRRSTRIMAGPCGAAVVSRPTSSSSAGAGADLAERGRGLGLDDALADSFALNAPATPAAGTAWMNARANGGRGW